MKFGRVCFQTKKVKAMIASYSFFFPHRPLAIGTIGTRKIKIIAANT